MQNFNSPISNFNGSGRHTFIFSSKSTKDQSSVFQQQSKIPLTFINLKALPTPFYTRIFAIGTNAIKHRLNTLNFEFQKAGRLLM